MKYFTPELIVMGQSDDDRVLQEQNRLWEEAGAQYVAYLHTVRPHLAAGLRQIDERYHLHDAIICGMGKQDHAFVIVLQLDTPPRSILTFTYDLVEEPAIVKGVLPPALCAPEPLADWQYDEIEMVPGTPTTWAQSILLGNGWEVRLHFRDVRVQEAEAILPFSVSGSTSASRYASGSLPERTRENAPHVAQSGTPT
jgi:hypothetical protein